MRYYFGPHFRAEFIPDTYLRVLPILSFAAGVGFGHCVDEGVVHEIGVLDIVTFEVSLAELDGLADEVLLVGLFEIFKVGNGVRVGGVVGGRQVVEEGLGLVEEVQELEFVEDCLAVGPELG